ncbi:hypothetical protein DIURU_002391 [Diutina rugosa]|uniref:tRNA (uracil-O(2)-)-methyltransferase n=1 Tax=Diutina rugosa TaxID=5481 RepID=A0A642UWZ2_DIURU|nr:uncharacterized protein DIURU_002391 [Diutina rugosa]KAA8903505.1 hypothetical protein DIURU_002391 [Diutina rugosa]
MAPSEEWVLNTPSPLGDDWVPICQYSDIDFSLDHFLLAMDNLIREPNINSTVIMRADILKERRSDQDPKLTFDAESTELPDFPGSESSEPLHRNIDDTDLRQPPIALDLNTTHEVVRRIIPRNPFKDYIINQTCLVARDDKQGLVVYVPHISEASETPFYLPPVQAIGIFYGQLTTDATKTGLSIHYIPFGYEKGPEAVAALRASDISSRPQRIALRLLNTAAKHSLGRKTGYAKRVNHDKVVPRVNFQNRYLALKQKYADHLVNNWQENTDPRKHVFEDLAIAAFLIEFWAIAYENPKEQMQFRDLGCGNGLLVYILLQEGYKGEGIDARARKSWSSYPESVQSQLKEQVIIPQMLLKPHPAVQKVAPHITDNGRMFLVPDFTLNTDTYCSAGSLLESPRVCTAEFPPDTFIIGNHSDELTCWIPLLGYPFIVIPCCSHALSGAKFRFPSKRAYFASGNGVSSGNSQYGALVDHVEDLATQMGWQVEKEMLRIPSTRNAAIIATKHTPAWSQLNDDAKEIRVHDVIHLEGGAEGWVQNSVALMKRAPRGH